MNDLTRTPKTRTVTDASGKSVVVSEPSDESLRIIDEIIGRHRDAFIRLANR